MGALLVILATVGCATLLACVPLEEALALDQFGLFALHADLAVPDLGVLQPACEELGNDVVSIADHIGPEVVIEIFGHVRILLLREVDLPIAPVLIRIALAVPVVKLGGPDNSASLGR